VVEKVINTDLTAKANYNYINNEWHVCFNGSQSSIVAYRNWHYRRKPPRKCYQFSWQDTNPYVLDKELM